MKLTRLIVYDIYQGVIKNLFKYLPLALLIIIECILYLYHVQSSISYEALSQTYYPTTGNYLAIIFAGIPEYIPSNRDVFPVPFTWLLFFIYLHYLLSAYPKADLYGYGQHILMSVHSRKIWWAAKVVFSIVGVFIYYCLTISICFLFGAFSGGCSLYPNSVLAAQDISFAFSKLPLFQLLLSTIIMPFLVSVTIAVFQLLLNFLLTPIASLIIIISIFVASAYFMNPLLPGEYAMLKRTIIFAPNGVKFKFGICFLGVTLIACLLIGFCTFERYDILASNKIDGE